MARKQRREKSSLELSNSLTGTNPMSQSTLVSVSPFQQIFKPKLTSTPKIGSSKKKLNFDIDPKLPNLSLLQSHTKKKKKQMSTSEKWKLGILVRKPKFCPFCNFICERMIYNHIKQNHTDQLKMPTSVSLNGINKIILNFSKKNNALMPLQQIVDIMGDNWFNPDLRKMFHMFCVLGQITTYGRSWELDHVFDNPNPFEQFIV